MKDVAVSIEEDSNEPKSITLWFDQLRRGDQLAAQRLWDRLFERLVLYAKTRMKNANRCVSDEEDIAIGVMSALCGAASRGELPSIDNREDLWRMLLSWTHNDIIDHCRYHQRTKRGGRVRDFTADDMNRGNAFSLDDIVGNTPPADVLHEMGDQFHLLLNRLPQKQLQEIAIARLHGHSNEEIAKTQNVSIRTIERKLNLIRNCWADV